MGSRPAERGATHHLFGAAAVVRVEGGRGVRGGSERGGGIGFARACLVISREGQDETASGPEVR